LLREYFRTISTGPARLAAGLLLAMCATAQPDQYTRAVYEAIATGNLASVSAAVIAGGQTSYLVARGYANRHARVRATPDTVYPFGEITTTFTAASIAALASTGKISLDDQVEKYLGGVRIKGQEPGAPVTIRHVLAHASGLVDSREPLAMHRGALPAQPAPLLFSNILFAIRRPATEVRYSHVGYGALGLLLTGVTGQTIPEHFRAKWLSPLDMSDTGFSVSGALQERLAMGYTRPSQGDAEAMQMFYHSPSSPLMTADGLAGTARDLARWLALHLNRGTNEHGRELIAAEAVDAMHRVQFSALTGRKYLPQSLFDSDGAGWGLGWVVWPCDGGECIGHAGSSPGYTAILAGDRKRKTGVAVLTNSDGAQRILIRLAKELLRMAKPQISGEARRT
jgi:CubicO group peptidase (beta-lactamase class C family)